MHARQLLRKLGADLDRDIEINPENIRFSLSGTADDARAIITQYVEGKIKIFEITARELCVHEGLTENRRLAVVK